MKFCPSTSQKCQFDIFNAQILLLCTHKTTILGVKFYRSLFNFIYIFNLYVHEIFTIFTDCVNHTTNDSIQYLKYYQKVDETNI